MLFIIESSKKKPKIKLSHKSDVEIANFMSNNSIPEHDFVPKEAPQFNATTEESIPVEHEYEFRVYFILFKLILPIKIRYI